MRLSTEIGDRRTFVLTKALMIYEEQESRREQFATVHKIVRRESSPNRPELGPGRLLTLRFLEKLSTGLKREATVALLPENVLAYTSGLLVWWSPRRLHTIFFSDGAEDRARVNGRTCPHPPLVWKVKRGRLSLRALTEAIRPVAGTALMIAPYWNTEPGFGGVCEGTMPRPKETHLNTMTQWEESYFNSRFTHPSGAGKLTSHPGGFMGLWTELAETPEFPAKFLTPAKQTLLEFVRQ